MNEPAGGVLERPSSFWRDLGAQHEQDLARFGPDEFKRRQALRYFCWSWHWSRLARSEQMRFLLCHTPPARWLACALAPTVLADASWQGVEWPQRDRWLYAFAVRLLWEYARRRDRLGVLALPEPTLGKPLPVYWRGRLISQDLANTALELNALASLLRSRPPTSILEVGAGYGRTAYALLSLFPEASYTIVDIEPAISIARWYLTQIFPSARLRFLTPDQAESIGAGSVDVVLSVSSLQEMTPQQVLGYLGLFDHVAAGGVVYLKQWEYWYNPQDRLTLRFADYPIPDRWQVIFRGPAPVQRRFTQAAWTVPPR